MASASPPSPPQQDNMDVEGRLREAEDRLREAIEELQRRQLKAGAARGPRCQQHQQHCPPCDHAAEEPSCVANAIGNLCQSFLLSYGVRVGIGILLRAFKLARRQSYSSLLDLKQLVSEKDLIVREEACRIGLFFGGFTGSYHALRCFLRKLRKKETPLNAILAGSIAGLSILALEDSNRKRTLALYLLARLAQCAYNSAKSKNKFHFWGSHWKHGDSLLFALACAQEIKKDANSELDSLYNEIRPAIEEHERDSQDSVATSVAEKWIAACCLKLKAEFDLYSSIVKNVACTPRRPQGQAKPSEGDDENGIKSI